VISDDGCDEQREKRTEEVNQQIQEMTIIFEISKFVSPGLGEQPS
jgi:hypothetical protein